MILCLVICINYWWIHHMVNFVKKIMKNYNRLYLKNHSLNMFMMIKLLKLYDYKMDKFSINKFIMVNKHLLNFIWLIMFYLIVNKLWMILSYYLKLTKKLKFIIWILTQCIFIKKIIKNIYLILKTVYVVEKTIMMKMKLLFMQILSVQNKKYVIVLRYKII